MVRCLKYAFAVVIGLFALGQIQAVVIIFLRFTKLTDAGATSYAIIQLFFTLAFAVVASFGAVFLIQSANRENKDQESSDKNT